MKPHGHTEPSLITNCGEIKAWEWSGAEHEQTAHHGGGWLSPSPYLPQHINVYLYPSEDGRWGTQLSELLVILTCNQTGKDAQVKKNSLSTCSEVELRSALTGIWSESCLYYWRHICHLKSMHTPTLANPLGSWLFLVFEFFHTVSFNVDQIGPWASGNSPASASSVLGLKG